MLITGPVGFELLASSSAVLLESSGTHQQGRSIVNQARMVIWVIPHHQSVASPSPRKQNLQHSGRRCHLPSRIHHHWVGSVSWELPLTLVILWRRSASISRNLTMSLDGAFQVGSCTLPLPHSASVIRATQKTWSTDKTELLSTAMVPLTNLDHIDQCLWALICT